MSIFDLTGDEQSIISTLLAGEIRRQRELQKLDVNKQNPNYGAAAAAETVIRRLRKLKEKIDAAATPAPATTTGAPAATSTAQPARRRRAADSRGGSAPLL